MLKVPDDFHGLIEKSNAPLLINSCEVDPQFPQEFRVEVYIPPYLSSGLTQPSFTIEDTDWAYGDKVPITVTLHQGTTSGMRISLIGG